jgi:hypothetical protein
MKTGSLGQPGFHLWMFVRGLVIDNQMQVKVSRHRFLDLPKEGEEYLMPMARLALSNYLASCHIKSSK